MRRDLRWGAATFVPGSAVLGFFHFAPPRTFATRCVVYGVGFATALGYIALMRGLEERWFGSPSGTTSEAFVHLAFNMFWKISLVLVLVAVGAVANP